jgi:hypothetical protein
MQPILVKNNALRILLFSLFLVGGPIMVSAQSATAGNSEENPPIEAPVREKFSLIRTAEMDKWMSARIGWVAAISGLVGFFVSAFYLTKIPYGPSMNAEPRARKILVVLIAFIVPPLGVLFLFADMYVNWFPGKEVFALLSNLFGLQVLLMLVASLSSFTLVAGVIARIKPFSHCPYLTWSKRLTLN